MHWHLFVPDIWGTSDQFYFYHGASKSGDLEYEVFVEDFVADHEWAKGGIMIRDGLTDDSAHFSLFVTGSNGLSTIWRTCDGCDTSGDGNGSVDGRNAWLKVTKTGNVFQAHYKIDDSTDWVLLGSAQTMQFSDESFVGVAVTSHDNGNAASLQWRYKKFSPTLAPTTTSPTGSPVAFQVGLLYN